MKSLAIVFATLLLAACAHVPAERSFRVEPENRLTARNEIDFAGGEVLYFDAWGLTPDDVLSFDRCGEACNSAKNVFWMRGFEDRRPRYWRVELAEPGRYYFWVQRKNERDETGPLLIDDAGYDDEGFRARFRHDVHVLVRRADGTRLVPPASPPEELLREGGGSLR